MNELDALFEDCMHGEVLDDRDMEQELTAGGCGDLDLLFQECIDDDMLALAHYNISMPN